MDGRAISLPNLSESYKMEVLPWISLILRDEITKLKKIIGGYPCGYFEDETVAFLSILFENFCLSNNNLCYYGRIGASGKVLSDYLVLDSLKNFGYARINRN